MKVLVLNGSPKKRSDTFRLTDAFLKGLNKTQEHEVNIIHVIEKDIAPCRGCFGCWKKLDGHCVIIGRFRLGAGRQVARFGMVANPCAKCTFRTDA